MTANQVRPRFVLGADTRHTHVGDRDGWVYRTVCGMTIDPHPMRGVILAIKPGDLECDSDLAARVTCAECRQELRDAS